MATHQRATRHVDAFHLAVAVAGCIELIRRAAPHRVRMAHRAVPRYSDAFYKAADIRIESTRIAAPAESARSE